MDFKKPVQKMVKILERKETLVILKMQVSFCKSEIEYSLQVSADTI